METNGILVELEHITQTYGRDQRGFPAVEDVNLSVREGEFVALLGPSGCGKSTLLRIITGLQHPTGGRVLYRGEVLRGVNPHATIVFQTFALFPWLTVAENVEVALKARGVPAAERTKRAIDLLDRVGLDGFEAAYPRELSGGMRQKVGFARAVVVEPELLCLDEPFSALDVLSADALRGELLELWTSHNIPTRAILMVTHSIEEAVFMADRIVIMDKDPGRVVAELRVDLAHPRQKNDHAFLNVVDRVYTALAGQTEAETIELGVAPGEPGTTRGLPNVTIDGLAGLVEHLDALPENKVDLYRVAEDLQMDSDRLLRLTEAAEQLGFVTVAQGNVGITPLGEAFAEANILARKVIFASRLRRLPIFKWLLTMLRAGEKQELRGELVRTALELEFPPAEAERQLETIVRWGRYAELLAYNDAEEVLYLERLAPQSALAEGKP